MEFSSPWSPILAPEAAQNVPATLTIPATTTTRGITRQAIKVGGG